jgi:hypothetical protein
LQKEEKEKGDSKMYKKKMLALTIATLLAASILMGIPLVKASPDYIGVWPVSYEGHTIGEEFTIDINVSAINLAGFEYKFRWNNTLLEVISYSITPPWATYFIGGDVMTDLGDGRNQHLLGVSSLPVTGWTGETTICTYTFKVKYAPYFPEPDGYSLLDLVDTKFADTVPLPIPHDEYDGEYTIKAGVPPLPTVYVDPPTVTGVYGATFTVDIKIRELAAVWDLMGWEFWLKYNTDVLDCLDVEIGPFLGGFVGPSGRFNITKFGDDYYPPYSNITFEMMGEVSVAEVLLGNHTKPYGNGILATITFNATWETTVYPPPSYPLELYIVKLVDSTAHPIGHFVEDGVYITPYKVTGRDIDLYTENERCPDWTNVIGIGPHEEADAYAPQENVTLYAKVTYNGDPVQNKLVAFEIHGPENSIYNVTFTRTAFTNADGIANVTFRIPWPCEDSDTIIFGTWYIYACVDIAEVKVSDDLTFEVGWILEIIDLELVDSLGASRTSVSKTEYAYFNMTIKSISIDVVKHALLTVVIYDDLGVPVGFMTFTYNTTMPEEVFNFQIYIPKWAYKGAGTAYGNIYTAMPTTCGVPYCPEYSITFGITS